MRFRISPFFTVALSGGCARCRFGKQICFLLKCNFVVISIAFAPAGNGAILIANATNADSNCYRAVEIILE